jgi:hypothetical protein
MKKLTKLGIYSGAAAICFGVSAQIVTFDFSSNASPTTTAADMGATAVSVLAPTTSLVTGGQFRASGGWQTGSGTVATGGGGYLQFTLTPDAGFTFTPTGFSFDAVTANIGGSGANSKLALTIGGSEIGVSFTTATGVPQNTIATRSGTISGVADLNTATEFKIFVFDTTSGAGLVRFDNITVTGTVSPVPEPSQIAMVAGLGLIGFALYRRRSR